MNRRDFLKFTGVAIAGAALVRQMPAASPPSFIPTDATAFDGVLSGETLIIDNVKYTFVPAGLGGANAIPIGHNARETAANIAKTLNGETSLKMGYDGDFTITLEPTPGRFPQPSRSLPPASHGRGQFSVLSLTNPR